MKKQTETKEMRRRTEEELARARAYLEHSLASAPDGVVLLDKEGKTNYVNPAFLNWLGRSADDFIGKTILEISPPIMTPKTTRAIAEKVKRRIETGGAVTGIEIEIIDKDGKKIPISYSASEIRDDKGNILGEVAFMRDITERKRAEEALRESEERFRTLTEKASDGITIIDADGNVLYESPSVERILGYGQDNWVGKPAFETVHPDDVSEAMKAYQFIVDNPGEVATVVIRSRHKDGSWHWMECVGRNLLEDTRVNGVVINYRDITERKKAEEELKKHRDHLEELVEERTKHLEEKSQELSEINVLLEEASRHKSEFLANMSHELRTPLTSIIGYTKLILDGGEGEIKEEQRKDLAIVHSSSQHLLQMINDLLDISKIEAGRVELHWQEFSVSDLLSEAVLPVQRLAEEKGLTLAYDVAAGIDKLYGDKGRVRQVLLNILGNAVKFTGEGGIDLRVSESDTDFTFSVTDTGIGIGEDDLETIFDSFEQVGSAQIAGYEGTGLGLAISKQFIEMHGGMIWANSQPGKGSTFTFTLPKKGTD